MSTLVMCNEKLDIQRYIYVDVSLIAIPNRLQVRDIQVGFGVFQGLLYFTYLLGRLIVTH